MAISDLKTGQGKVDITVEVVSVSEPRTFEKFGKPGRVASAKARDETGEIMLSIWNEDVDKVKTGDKVKITNGFVSEFRGEKQLSTGRFGKLEVVEKGKPSAAVKPGVEEDFVE
ncbi:MAG TPA: OB-fold nucleic acid binding domain-containing protein [Candidatus Nanoarchaeia archaeon]|nr:OB-fold nucleic acid binding domain-containing protein [Candidatus Nanoarchaeia archaeon]